MRRERIAEQGDEGIEMGRLRPSVVVRGAVTGGTADRAIEPLAVGEKIRQHERGLRGSPIGRALRGEVGGDGASRIGASLAIQGMESLRHARAALGGVRIGDEGRHVRRREPRADGRVSEQARPHERADAGDGLGARLMAGYAVAAGEHDLAVA